MFALTPDFNRDALLVGGKFDMIGNMPRTTLAAPPLTAGGGNDDSLIFENGFED